MTEADPPPPAAPQPDALAEAIARALAAASAATDAAHEAEAVLTARSAAAQAMDRTARRSGWLAAVAGGGAVLVLALGGLALQRGTANLHEAATVQAAATAGFVERLAELNTALDRMDGGIEALAERDKTLDGRIDALIAEVGSRLADLSRPPEPPPQPQTAALAPQLEQLRADILAAIADSDLSMTARLADLKPPPPAPAGRSAPASRPAAPPPNPFRFP